MGLLPLLQGILAHQIAGAKGFPGTRLGQDSFSVEFAQVLPNFHLNQTENSMIIKPKVRGFVCVTAHPIGCAANVQEQIDCVKAQGLISGGPKNVLIIGASTGYGLSTRIVSAFGCRASTFGVFYERPAENDKPASAGWYNSVALEIAAHADGLYAKSINGDGFSNEIKKQTTDLIEKDLGQVDLVVYSVAAPRRTHPKTGQTFRSALKTIGNSYRAKNLDTDKKLITDLTVEPATEDEITGTIQVMGGEDWQMWIDALIKAGLLAQGVITVAYTYIGPEMTWPVYKNGTIGLGKEHLEKSARKINDSLKNLGGSAYISANKAVVTQASSALPIVPLYISILLKVMKEKGIEEGCIEQIYRLFKMNLFSGGSLDLDENGLLRIDDLELRPDVQQGVTDLWERINNDNLDELSDFANYQQHFLKLFGFGLNGINYDEDVDPEVDFPS